MCEWIRVRGKVIEISQLDLRVIEFGWELRKKLSDLCVVVPSVERVS